MREEKLGYQQFLIQELGENYEEKANIGVYFQENEISYTGIVKYKNRLIKWHKMAKYDYINNEPFETKKIEAAL